MKANSNAFATIMAFVCGIIVLLVAFPTFQFLNSPLNYHSEVPLASSSSGGCETPFPSRPAVTQTTDKDSGDVLAIINTPIFLMKPGTTAKLCVTYTGISSGQPYSGKVYSQVVGDIGTKNVTITPHPADITDKDYYFATAFNSLQNKHSFNVIYDISAPVNSRGFYGLWPLGVCPGLPLAIGYAANEINYSRDFPWTSGRFFGCSGFIDYKIVGLSGIEVSYVTNQTKSNIGYEKTGIDYRIIKQDQQPIIGSS